jgi:diguanylate cyclase (GGDEF)-like protein
VLRPRLTISRKFFGVLVALAPLIVAVAVAGVVGLGAMKSEFDRVFSDNVRIGNVSARLAVDLSRAQQSALDLARVTSLKQGVPISITLDQVIVPAVDADLGTLRALRASGSALGRRRVSRLERVWAKFIALLDTGALAAGAPAATDVNAVHALQRRITDTFAPLTALTQSEAAAQEVEAGREYRRAIATYHDSELWIFLITLGALVLGVGGMVLLTRNVVPRIKRYAAFAAAVTTGELTERLSADGPDELAALGRALDEMVDRRASDSDHENRQREFADTLQVTSSEEVAHRTLKRQIERSIPQSTAVVLNRNNSADRLEATTEVATDSPLREALIDTKPSSCFAVLFARPHAEDPDHEPLTRCAVCGHLGTKTSCQPLLVGGEVIGSVLVQHDQPLDDASAATLAESVAQAAPVLANLRNLALAEFRASTDSLTGLPNKRAVQDTVKRMGAQASRSLSPLSAIVLDLDHFKQINDTFGHNQGDDILAAVGAVLADTVRRSDFVGRNGGEEFIVLLPDTDTRSAEAVAEKIRTSLTQIAITGVQREITASFGVATIPDHAGDGNQLVRSADRALYVAKTNGRNRTETAIAAAISNETSEPAAKTVSHLD